jgi:4-oxalocrotonate tautomerase
MPIIDVTLIEGRDTDTVREFSEAIIRAAHDLLDAPAASVRVIVHQIPPSLFFVGGKDHAVQADPTTSQAPR